MSIDSDTSEQIVFRITEPYGCPTCGSDGAVHGKSRKKNPSNPSKEPELSKSPICAGCGEVLGPSIVELRDKYQGMNIDYGQQRYK